VNSNLLAWHVHPGCVCLIHRCAPHPDNEALQECPRNLQGIHYIQNYTGHCGTVDTCDVPLSSLLQQGVSRPICEDMRSRSRTSVMSLRDEFKPFGGPRRSRVYQHFVNARTIQMCWRQSVARVALIKILAARGIQTFWRCHSFRKPYHEYICARHIQTFWRCKTLCNAFDHRMPRTRRYESFCSARSIHAFWRSRPSQAAYKHYKAALKIQTI
jgi:hypothetical protein